MFVQAFFGQRPIPVRVHFVGALLTVAGGLNLRVPGLQRGDRMVVEEVGWCNGLGGEHCRVPKKAEEESGGRNRKRCEYTGGKSLQRGQHVLPKPPVANDSLELVILSPPFSKDTTSASVVPV